MSLGCNSLSFWDYYCPHFVRRRQRSVQNRAAVALLDKLDSQSQKACHRFPGTLLLKSSTQRWVHRSLKWPASTFDGDGDLKLKMLLHCTWHQKPVNDPLADQSSLKTKNCFQKQKQVSRVLRVLLMKISHLNGEKVLLFTVHSETIFFHANNKQPVITISCFYQLMLMLVVLVSALRMMMMMMMVWRTTDW